MLLLAGWLDPLYGMQSGLYTAIAIANIAYGLYSFSLVVRKQRSRSAILLLVFANATWSLSCSVGAVVLLLTQSASGFGIAHVIAEGVFVGGLAALEWRYRDRLATSI